MEKKIEEMNKFIAEFMGATYAIMDTDKTVLAFILSEQRFPDNMYRCKTTDLKYHSSWDWQIPAFSKAVLLLDKTVDNKTDKYAEMYAEAITNDDKLKGFEALVGMIKFINSSKTK